LLERAPAVVSRAEMRERLWAADTFVDFDRNLNAAVKTLRHALNDSVAAPRFVETLPRRGYRFLVPVETIVQRDEARVAVPSAPAPAPPMIAPGGLPERRWGSRAVLVAVVLASLLTTSFNPASSARSQAADCPPRSTLAVLPFLDQHSAGQHQGKDHPDLADRLNEQLSVRLAAWNPGRLGVVSRRSVEKYRCSSKSVAEIGRELGVTFVVDGTVRREGDRIRVTAEFVQVSDQTQIWSETIDRPAAELAAAQEELAQKLLKAVAVCLLPAQSPREVATNTARVPGE